MVEAMVAEGYDPIEIAAAALKVARAEEKQRPIPPIGEVVERPPKRERYGKGRQNSKGRRNGNGRSHEAGMVRVTLNAGKAQGVRVNPGGVSTQMMMLPKRDRSVR